MNKYIVYTENGTIPVDAGYFEDRPESNWIHFYSEKKILIDSFAKFSVNRIKKVV